MRTRAGPDPTGFRTALEEYRAQVDEKLVQMKQRAARIALEAINLEGEIGVLRFDLRQAAVAGGPK